MTRPSKRLIGRVHAPTARLRHAAILTAVLAAALGGCPAQPTPALDAGGTDAPLVDAPVADVRTGACTGDDECSDGSFCNGRERCDAAAAGADERGCAPSRGRPCLDVQVCEEVTDTCVTDCGADRDADDDGVDAANCPGGTDCDDADALRHPGLTEVCDTEDHDEDCDDATFGERDLDRDGAFDARCCNEDATGARSCGDDCDDTRRSVRPLGAEVCNGLDDDCSGTVDEGVTVPGFADMDRDLHGDPTAATMACPGAVGVSSIDDDCADDRRDAHGAQLEICDALDNDCDGRVDEHARPVTWYRDADGDGFGAAASGTMVSCTPPGGYSLLWTDCDDDSRSRSPLGEEICDAVDDDCNGVADRVIGANDLEDDDGDGHADAACGGDDCDDGDPSAFLGAPEICDFRDSDCDGLSDQGASPPAGATADATADSDWYADVDLDGHGASGSAIRSCEPQLGRVSRAGDCADLDSTRHPGALDPCDGRDDDCDTRIDEDAPDLAFYADADADRDGEGPPTLSCSPPAGLTELPGDCAPADPTRGPGTVETCNSRDDDCDGEIDEELFRDADGDGRGDPSMPVGATCRAGDVGFGDDCNDAVSTRSPAESETCNLIDDDCDGAVDEPGAELCVFGDDHGMCVAGSCAFTCPAGRADCDGDAANGCETDLTTDARNCGTCGTSCGVAGICGGIGGCDDPIVRVAVGPGESCAVRQRGGVLCWSSGAAAAVDGLTDVVDVVRSLSSTCALRSNGEVWCWGYGGYGLLGRGFELGYLPPRPVPAVPRAIALAATHTTVCAVRPTGEVVCWGLSAWPGGAFASYVAAEIPGLSAVDAIFAGRGNDISFVLRTAGDRLLAFGDSPWIGGSSTTLTEVTTRFRAPVRWLVQSDSTGGDAGCARLEDDSTWCWGTNADASLGDMGAASLAVPREISGTWDGAVEIAQAYGLVTCARFPDGAVRCSGDCRSLGLRGDGCAASPRIGTTVMGLDGASAGDLDDAVSLSGDYRGGDGAFCAVRRRGDVVCWGAGSWVGSGASVVSTPIRVITD